MDWHNRLDVVREKIKSHLYESGLDTLAALEKQFNALDLDNAGKLDITEFESFLAKIGVFLSKQELRAVYDVYDTNRDGFLTFNEFITPLRNDMPSSRIEIIREAFQFLDEDGKGYIPLELLLKRYNPSGHTRVRMREKTEEQVYKDFEQAMTQRAKKGVVTEDGFLEYYKDVNATLSEEEDEYFVDLVTKTWGISRAVKQVVVEPVESPEKANMLEELMHERVKQHTNIKEDERITILRAAKYVDLANKRALDLDLFSKLLTYIGCALRPADTKILFARYVDESTGLIDPVKLANHFLLKGSGNVPNVKPKFKVTVAPTSVTVMKVRKTLFDRGPKGMQELEKLFKQIDTQDTNTITHEEFAWAMKQNGQALEKEDYEYVFRYFDKDNRNAIDYTELLKAVRGTLNERRKAVVGEVFKALDSSKKGVIPLGALLNAYNVERNPKFVTEEKTREELQNELLEGWEGVKKKQSATLEDFEDYYTNLSAVIEKDTYFEQMVRRSWKTQ